MHFYQIYPRRRGLSLLTISSRSKAIPGTHPSAFVANRGRKIITKTGRKYPLWFTIRNAKRNSTRVIPNKTDCYVHGDIDDSTSTRDNPFHPGNSYRPNSAFLAVQLSREDDTQLARGRHFCALGRQRAR